MSDKKISKLKVVSIISIVALCIFLALCLVQRGQIGDLETENSGLEQQIETMQTEHDTALREGKAREDAKDTEITELKAAAEEAEEEFNALQTNHDQLEKEVGNLKSLRRADRSKITKLTAENKELKSDLSATKAVLADGLNTVKEIRESVKESTQTTERMLASVAQSRARIAEINEIIDRIRK